MYLYIQSLYIAYTTTSKYILAYAMKYKLYTCVLYVHVWTMYIHVFNLMYSVYTCLYSYQTCSYRCQPNHFMKNHCYVLGNTTISALEPLCQLLYCILMLDHRARKTYKTSLYVINCTYTANIARYGHMLVALLSAAD
jgi:hypothetical protein